LFIKDSGLQMALNLTETRLPGQASNFTATLADQLGYAQVDGLGNFCLISYLPKVTPPIRRIRFFENRYVAFINDTSGTAYAYSWTITYKDIHSDTLGSFAENGPEATGMLHLKVSAEELSYWDDIKIIEVSRTISWG
jgi:hypothetical protein